MKERREITRREDIEWLVNTFYGKVREDELIGPIFNQRIGNRWPEHLDKMYRFWSTILLDEKSYLGRPFVPHATMPLYMEHFERWMHLFIDTVDEHFEGEKAKEAIHRAANMAAMFHHKIEYYRNNSQAKPI